MAFHPVTTTRSYEHVVRQIAAEIQSGRFSRGERLPTERELGANFGVSRGVVREAVKVLDAMGLVEPRQGSGLYVRDDPVPPVTRALTLSVSPEEKSVRHLFEFRRTLETESARLAASRRSDDQAASIAAASALTAEAAAHDGQPAFGPTDLAFHAAIYAAADNPYMAVAIAAVRDMTSDVVAQYIGLRGSLAVAAGHHAAIAAAISAGDPEAAAAAMAEHLTYTADAVGAALHDSPAKRREVGT